MTEIHISNLEVFYKPKNNYDVVLMKSLNLGYFYLYDFGNPEYYHRIFSDIPSETSKEHLIPVNIENPDSPVFFTFLKRNSCFNYGYYEGNKNPQNIIHGLDKQPELLIIKPIGKGGNVVTWFNGLKYNEYMILNNNEEKQISNTIWRESFPNRNHFLIGQNNMVNDPEERYLYMVFCPGENFSYGRYEGNGKEIEFVKKDWKLAVVRNINSISNWIMIINDQSNNIFRLNLPNSYSSLNLTEFEKNKDNLIIKGNSFSLNREGQYYFYFILS